MSQGRDQSGDQGERRQSMGKLAMKLQLKERVGAFLKKDIKVRQQSRDAAGQHSLTWLCFPVDAARHGRSDQSVSYRIHIKKSPAPPEGRSYPKEPWYLASASVNFALNRSAFDLLGQLAKLRQDLGPEQLDQAFLIGRGHL